jgi:hypothetical protein
MGSYVYRQRGTLPPHPFTISLFHVLWGLLSSQSVRDDIMPSLSRPSLPTTLPKETSNIDWKRCLQRSPCREKKGGRWKKKEKKKGKRVRKMHTEPFERGINWFTYVKRRNT